MTPEQTAGLIATTLEALATAIRAQDDECGEPEDLILHKTADAIEDVTKSLRMGSFVP